MSDYPDSPGSNRLRTDKPLDASSYARLDLYVLLDGVRGHAKITTVVYCDRGQLVVGRVVLPRIALDLAMNTALDLAREHWPELGAARLPFGPAV